MEITPNLHAFVWKSTTTNNCNSYFIDGPSRVLIDPGHSRLFDHVELGLKELGLAIADMDLPVPPDTSKCRRPVESTEASIHAPSVSWT